jgi:Methyltransferase domain
VEEPDLTTEAAATDSPIMDAYESWENTARNHHAGTFPTDTLRLIERQLPSSVNFSAETGCGKSTILLSNIAAHHTVFCLDERSLGNNSSIQFYERCPLTKTDRLQNVFGPTQATLPAFQHTHKYDIVLLDGPHGWPYPELEYYYFYPHIVTGGLLIVDDCDIPTIGRMADVLIEDDMWELATMAGPTAIFRRTDAPLFDPTGDLWWEQKYNRRRVSVQHGAYLPGSSPIDQISSVTLGARLNAETPIVGSVGIWCRIRQGLRTLIAPNR